MMKMSGRVVSCCVALFLALTSVSAVKKLKSINDLKKINFDQSVPKHSLVLLYWFANAVDIDNNNVIWLTFDPNEEYGSPHYGNYEELLDPLPQGRYRYYTVGNLNQDTSVQLPWYVIRPPTEYVGRNLDRIIFRVREHNTGWQAWQSIDQVYITQHYGDSYEETSYDPAHTYRISTNLLRQIREFSDDSRNNADDSQLRYLRNTWGDLACLGLLLFIVTQDKHPSNRHNRRPQHVARRNTPPDFFVNMPENSQDHQNNDGCQRCRCLCISLFALVLLVAFILFYMFY